MRNPFMLVLLLVMSMAQVTGAASFSDDQVVKHLSVGRSFPTSILREPAPGQTSAKIYFELLILKDRSLWVRPLLSPNEEHVSLAGISIDRAEPQPVALSGYVPVEMFKLDAQAYLVVRTEGGDDGQRFLIALNPDMGPRPRVLHGLGRRMTALQLAVAAVLYTPGPTASVAGAVMNAVAALTVAIECHQGLRGLGEEYRACKARVDEALVPELAAGNEPLVIARYRFRPDHSVADVVLRDSQGQEQSLTERRRAKSCAVKYLL